MSASTHDYFSLASTNHAGSSWATDPDLTIALGAGPTTGFSLYNKHAFAIVEWSLDGTNTHGELDPADGTRGEVFDFRRIDKLWLRIKTGSTGPAVVAVKAWVRGS